VNQEEIRKQLSEPFTSKEIEWKIQTTTQDKTRGMAVAYVDSRAIQKRLDETVGPFYWRNSYASWQDKSQLCGLSIFDTERGEWVTKFDGAENTDFEPTKGGLSDAFKRSAIVWGIGRYLYELGGVWVEIEQRGKSYAIKQDQYGKLEADYMKAIKRIFPERTRQAGAVTPSPSPAIPTENERVSETANSCDFDYKVISAKTSGKASQLLELVDGNGELIAAYIKKSDSQTITSGTHLRNVEMIRKEGSFGSYNLINTCEMVA
jgi:hypothetical protein